MQVPLHLKYALAGYYPILINEKR